MKGRALSLINTVNWKETKYRNLENAGQTHIDGSKKEIQIRQSKP